MQPARLAGGARQPKHDLRGNRGRVQGRLPGRQRRTHDLLAFRSLLFAGHRQLGYRLRESPDAGGVHRRGTAELVGAGQHRCHGEKLRVRRLRHLMKGFFCMLDLLQVNICLAFFNAHVKVNPFLSCNIFYCLKCLKPSLILLLSFKMFFFFIHQKHFKFNFLP